MYLPGADFIGWALLSYFILLIPRTFNLPDFMVSISMENWSLRHFRPSVCEKKEADDFGPMEWQIDTFCRMFKCTQ